MQPLLLGYVCKKEEKNKQEEEEEQQQQQQQLRQHRAYYLKHTVLTPHFAKKKTTWPPIL